MTIYGAPLGSGSTPGAKVNPRAADEEPSILTCNCLLCVSLLWSSGITPLPSVSPPREICQADKSAVSDGGEDQGAEEVTPFMGP